MLERVDAQLAPLDADTAPHPLARRTGSVLSLPTGNIAGELRPIAMDWRSRRATYDLFVDNDTASAIAAFAYPVSREQSDEKSDERVSWSACTIPPYTSVVVPIEVGLVRRAKTLRVVAELHAPSAHLTIDAALPRSGGPGAPRRKLYAAVAVAALVAAGFAGFTALSPHVIALDAPKRVAADQPFAVSYQYRAARYAEYTVETASGLQVRRGTLVNGDGTFTVTLPRGQKAYNLRLIAHGPFVDDARLQSIAVLAGSRALSRGGLPPVLTGVQLKDDFVRGGDEILVAYRTAADGGLVQLLDDQGNVRGEALLNPHLGNTALVAPFIDHIQDFRLTVAAERGGRSVVRTVPLRIGPAAPAFVPQLRPLALPPMSAVPPVLAVPSVLKDALPAAPAPDLAPDVNGPEPIAPVVTGPEPIAAPPVRLKKTAAPVVTIIQTPAPVHDTIELAATTFASMAPITVTILRSERALHVALMSTTGDELTGVDVAQGHKRVTIAAPHVQRNEQFLIVATYESGNGQETEVRPITIKAH